MNEGFNDLVGERLRSINGTKVKHMNHVVELLAPLLSEDTPPPHTHVVLQFYDEGETAIFETKALRRATPTMMAQHKIPSWTSLPLPGPAPSPAKIEPATT